MRIYETPCLEILELMVDEPIAVVVQSEPTVEDNDDDLSV